MTKEQLLAEVDDLLRAAPQPNDSRSDGARAWTGRAMAVIERWSPDHGVQALAAKLEIVQWAAPRSFIGLAQMVTLLHEARADLQMEVGVTSVVVPEGRIFDYFDEVRKMIEAARTEVFFVDPYLNADFVGRYLPHVVDGVAVRLLASKNTTALLAAVEMFSKQNGLSVEVRSSERLHDRYLFVDRAECYVSGASFKDGAKNSPAVLTQIIDGFQGQWETYDRLWTDAKVVL